VGALAAARLSVYSAKHDPFVSNAGPLSNLVGWESQDDVGGRMHFLLQPSDELSALLTGDYLRSQGTGSRGVDFLQAAMAGIALDGILVERMVKGGLEMIVGARRDPDWGPVVMVGLGGIFVETLKDVRLMPAWLPKERIVEQCYRLKGAAVLRGVRGRPAVDVEALADVVLRVAAAMMAQSEITEIDINPLTVLPSGQGAIALDALIVTRRE